MCAVHWVSSSPPRQQQQCRFSNSVSFRDLPTCVSSFCLTSFRLGLSHFALHFLAVPVGGVDVPGCLLERAGTVPLCRDSHEAVATPCSESDRAGAPQPVMVTRGRPIASALLDWRESPRSPRRSTLGEMGCEFLLIPALPPQRVRGGRPRPADPGRQPAHLPTHPRHPLQPPRSRPDLAHIAATLTGLLHSGLRGGEVRCLTMPRTPASMLRPLPSQRSDRRRPHPPTAVVIVALT